jgi:hypothetical protein
MIQFHSRLKKYAKRNVVRGFDNFGRPIIEEYGLTSLKDWEIHAPKFENEKIMFFPMNDTYTQENLSAAIALLNDFTGLLSTSKLTLNIEDLIQYKDKLSCFAHFGKILNTNQISKLYKIRYLSIESVKQLDISGLPLLEEIILPKIDFSKVVFGTLNHIKHLRLISSKNVSSIPLNDKTPLKYLQLMWDRDTRSLETLQDIKELEGVGLFRVSQLREWPDSTKMTNLKFIEFDDVNNFTDFRGLAKAPNLEWLRINIKGLEAKHLEPLLDCKSLKYINYYHTKKEMATAQELFKNIEINGILPDKYNTESFDFD